MSKYYNAAEIMEKATDKCWTVNTHKVLNHISWALSQVRKDIVDDIFDNCVLLITDKSEKGTYYPKNTFIDKSLISFSDSYIESASDSEIEHTVLQEFAHYYLGHRIPEDKEEKDRQEAEAEEQVKEWLAEFSTSAETPIERHRLDFDN
jgi:lactate dehydrogenase-like 2-hydroxyacid dehydrogenase